MENINEIIVTGVIAGLLTTFLVVVFKEVWMKIIQPWYQNLLYQDVKIEGQWYGRCDYYDIENENFLLDIKHKDQPNYYNIRLKRVGHKISGTMICESGWEEGRMYQIHGTFNNLILSATYKPDDESSMERASMSLMLKNNGRSLKGYSSMYMDEFDSVSPGKMMWTKEHAEGHLLTGELSIKKEKGRYKTVTHDTKKVLTKG